MGTGRSWENIDRGHHKIGHCFLRDSFKVVSATFFTKFLGDLFRSKEKCFLFHLKALLGLEIIKF